MTSRGIPSRYPIYAPRSPAASLTAASIPCDIAIAPKRIIAVRYPRFTEDIATKNIDGAIATRTPDIPSFPTKIAIGRERIARSNVNMSPAVPKNIDAL